MRIFLGLLVSFLACPALAQVITARKADVIPVALRFTNVQGTNPHQRVTVVVRNIGSATVGRNRNDVFCLGGNVPGTPCVFQIVHRVGSYLNRYPMHANDTPQFLDGPVEPGTTGEFSLSEFRYGFLTHCLRVSVTIDQAKNMGQGPGNLVFNNDTAELVARDSNSRLPCLPVARPT